jgi:hypothetical protein
MRDRERRERELENANIQNERKINGGSGVEIGRDGMR